MADLPQPILDTLEFETSLRVKASVLHDPFYQCPSDTAKAAPGTLLKVEKAHINTSSLSPLSQPITPLISTPTRPQSQSSQLFEIKNHSNTNEKPADCPPLIVTPTRLNQKVFGSGYSFDTKIKTRASSKNAPELKRATLDLQIWRKEYAVKKEVSTRA